MSKLHSFWIILASVVLASCGGGGGNTLTSPGGGGGGGGTGNATATQVQLLTSSPELPSDQTGASSVTLTAIVKDSNNTVVSGAIVTISATSGEISNPTPASNANGIVTAALSTRDTSNRVITLTASVTGVGGTVSTDTVNINVTGTTLVVTGPSALAQSQTSAYSIALRDSNGIGIAGETVTVTSSTGNTVSAATLTTGSGGETQFSLTGTVAGADTVTTSALGLTTNKLVTVSDDDFRITAPAAAAEINLNTPTTVTSLWEIAGVPQSGAIISFSSTRGTLTAATDTTDGNGEATVSIASSSAGPAVITATNPDGTSASVSVEFVATVADTLVMQADPFTVPVNKVSQIIAVVRDPNGNLVKNKGVSFELTDVTGGFLSVASDITDSSGTARTTYTAGSQSSAQNAVDIRAFVQDAPTVEDIVELTVAAQELFIVIGTGNDIFEPTPSLFAVEWDIIVTDVDGNPVPNKPVQVSVLSTDYRDGFLTINVAGDAWIQDPANYDECADEDTNRNGILDLNPVDEDVNGSGRLEAGNVSSVAPTPNDTAEACGSVGGPAGPETTVTTNDAGFARTCVIYPQDHNLWVRVDIEAEASVSGSEFASDQNFVLPAKAEDLNNVNASPPGQTSPFGSDVNCATPPP